MKKRLFYYLFAVVCTVALFASCSDDDGNDNDVPTIIPIEQEIVGNYKGTLSVKVDGTDMGIVHQNVSVTKAGENSIRLVIADFSFGALELGDIKLENCVLQANGDTYVCQREEQLTLESPVNTCNVKTNITVQNESVVVDLDITVPDLNNQVVKVVYQGTKLKGNESREAEILNFYFDKAIEANSIVVGEPSINDDNTITFVVTEGVTSDQLKALVPTIEISEKAILDAPEVIDFSEDMEYSVISESGDVVNTYIVKTPTSLEKPLISLKYDFDVWEEVTGTSFLTKSYSWESPSPKEELASANEGIAALRTSLGGNYKGDYATVKEEKGYGESGHAVKLVTLDTRGVGLAPAITPGSLFTGKFAFSFAGVSDPLSLTKFGLPYDKKPLKLKGVYKYTPGEPFIDGSDKSNIEETDEIDSPSISAVLYEAKDAEGKEVILTGNDINTSEYRVAFAELKNPTKTTEWTPIDEDFVYVNGKSYDATKEYKLAVVCSSSKEGDRFRGAANSTLIIDNLEVLGE